MRNITDAEPANKNHQVNGLGYLRFAPQTEKTSQEGIIDAEQYQDEFLTLLIRERQATKRHQSGIIEVD